MNFKYKIDGTVVFVEINSSNGLYWQFFSKETYSYEATEAFIYNLKTNGLRWRIPHLIELQEFGKVYNSSQVLHDKLNLGIGATYYFSDYLDSTSSTHYCFNIENCANVYGSKHAYIAAVSDGLPFSSRVKSVYQVKEKLEFF